MFSHFFLKLILISCFFSIYFVFFFKKRKGKKEEVNRMENSRKKENILKNKIMLT